MGNSRGQRHRQWNELRLVEFSQFCKQNNIEQTRYSPHHHQSNGKSESAVKIIKTSLKKTEKTALKSVRRVA